MRKFICLLIAVCGLSFGTSAIAGENLIKYPPMTAEEVFEVGEKAAKWFSQMIADGKEKEAIAELSSPPRFKLSPDGWKKLEKELDPTVFQEIQFLKGIEFEESAHLITLLRKKFPKEFWSLNATIIRNADEVYSTAWNKGSIVDYRFVVAYNCKSNVHIAHALLPIQVNVPIDSMRDKNGKYFIWETCNRLVRGESNSWWEDALIPNPFGHPAQMLLFMRNVEGSDYQIGLVARHIDLSRDELNAKFR